MGAVVHFLGHRRQELHGGGDGAPGGSRSKGGEHLVEAREGSGGGASGSGSGGGSGAGSGGEPQGDAAQEQAQAPQHKAGKWTCASNGLLHKRLNDLEDVWN